uniref:Integrase catalytic domain-containing protein n=1 Tax=Parascaris univalens TaxID=6257 RepID=A0A914ZX06_PARUN
MKSTVKTQLSSWPSRQLHGKRVRADFAGIVDGNFYLFIVDAYSQWPEIIRINSISRSATITWDFFAQFGKVAYLRYAQRHAIHVEINELLLSGSRNYALHSSPFHPQSNG